MALRTQIPDDDLEDIRLAVVMNGGVSLAIWIGGVTQEINLLTQARPGDGSVYGGLLDLVRATARADVIAGTSAGGINGAFLALATVYNADLGGLGALWAEKGGFLDLLRSATEGDPPSLLKGDDYFLPALRDAFDAVAPAGRRPAPRPAADAPVDLIITTSIMNGTLKTFVDDFGNPVVEVEHRGQFRFRRRPTPGAPDPFARENVTSLLALAARSTASFPVAFEPSFIPVGSRADDLHPDMTGVASWPTTRYVIDGGVLVNKPVGPALRSVFSLPADRQVRRVLAYVVPDPGEPKEAGPDDRAARPGIGRVLADSLVSLPRAQSIAEELEEVREHNRRVRDAQALRPDVTPQLGPQFESLAPQLFPTYRLIRARRAVAKIADVVGPITAPPERDGAPPAWTRDELMEAFGCAGSEAARALPFVPNVDDPDKATVWDWGLAPAERLGIVALDLFRRAMLAAPYDAVELRARLRGYRRRLTEPLTALRAARGNDDAYWAEQAALLGTPPENTAERAARLNAWVETALDRWPVTGPPSEAARTAATMALEATTRYLVDVLVEARATLREAAQAGQDEGGKELLKLLEGFRLTGRSSRTMARDVLRRVFYGEVALLALGAAGPEIEQPVDLVQVSGDTPNGFGGPSRVATKLAGVQMGHFGAFYKKSWRVNDWIWGRCDGATRLVQIVLSPARLRQLRLTCADVVEEVERLAVGPVADLRSWYDRDRPEIERELAFLDDASRPLPPSLPRTAMAVARRIQADLLATELPRLAAAVHTDVDQGGSRGPGLELARTYDAESRHGPLSPTRALTLFAGANVAGELAAEEAGTDLMAVTASRALAVGVSAADAKGAGLGPLRVITRPVRAIAMTAYGLVFAATRRSKIGTAVANAILAIGGALLALALIGDAPGWLKAAATVLVLGAIVEALLRSKVWELAVALAVPFTALLAVVLARDDLAELREDAAPVLAVAGIVAGLMLLGSARPPRRPARLLAWRPRLAWFLGTLALTAVAAVWMESISPGRILVLELALTTERAEDVLRGWPYPRGLHYLWRDFAFLAVYWLPLVFAVGWAAERYASLGHPRAAKAAKSFGWLPLYVAVFDVVENVLLLLMADHVRDTGAVRYDWLAPVATTFAAWKWAIFAVVAGYVVRAVFVRRQELTTAS